MAKKAPGQPCGVASECQSALCGGRCCNPGTPCTCPIQTVNNIVPNAGFDTSLGSWKSGTPNATGKSWVWQADDNLGCGFSGSGTIDNRAGTTDSAHGSICFTVPKSMVYNFGISLRALGTTSANFGWCELDFYNGASCLNGINPYTSWVQDGPTWSDYMATVNTGNSVSVGIDCFANPGVQLMVDQLYASPMPGMF